MSRYNKRLTGLGPRIVGPQLVAAGGPVLEAPAMTEKDLHAEQERIEQWEVMQLARELLVGRAVTVQEAFALADEFRAEALRRAPRPGWDR